MRNQPLTLGYLTVLVTQTLARVHAALDAADEDRLADARSSIATTINRLEAIENERRLNREELGLVREHMLRLGGVLRTLNRIK
jgi:hypothetical protein